MDQVYLFYKAAQKNMQREMLSSSIAARVAFGADRSQWQKFVDSVSPRRPRQVMTKEEYRKLRSIMNG
jgi:hypothetical protein